MVGEGDKLVPIINELAMANESEGGHSIVILSRKDKEELEELLNNAGIDLRGNEVSQSYRLILGWSCSVTHSSFVCICVYICLSILFL